MQDILQHPGPGLKKITLTSGKTSRSKEVDAKLLTRVFAKMEEIEICRFRKCLIDAVLNRSNKLKRFVLKGHVDRVDSALLVVALNNIETLEMEFFNADEANMLFKKMEAQ